MTITIPKTTPFSTFSIAFYIFVVDGVRNSVDKLIAASDIAHEWQTVPERVVVRSYEPFKFWWAPTMSLERLIASGAVNLVGRSV